MIELVEHTGIWALTTLGKPLLIWTIISLLIIITFRLFNNQHSVLRYATQISVILGLPLSILAAGFLSIQINSEPMALMYYAVVPTLEFSPTESGSAATGISYITLAGGVLILLSAISILYFAIKFIAAKVVVSGWEERATPIQEKNLRTLCSELIAQAKLKKSPALAYSSEVRGPLTYGWRNPVILLPETLTDEQDFKAAVIHELVHIKRGDYLIHLIVSAIRALFIWHPLVHILSRSIARNREISCDSKVLASQHIKAGSYASVLLSFATSPFRLKSLPVAMSEPPIKLEERIHAMQDTYNKPAQYARAARRAMYATILVMGIFITFSACEFNMMDEEHIIDLETAEIYLVVDEPLEPVGGLKAIYENLEYPAIARRAGIEGVVVTQFIVDAKGNVRNPRILRGIGGGADEAAMRAIEMTEWIPGKMNGKAVNMQFQVPIRFQLENNSQESETESKESAQNEQKNEPDVFLVVEDAPNPVGGVEGLLNNLIYPEEAKRERIEGTVVVQFIVSSDGTTRNHRILRGIGGGADEAAIEAIKNTSWEPGQQRGRNVDVQFQVPIRFQLQ